MKANIAFNADKNPIINIEPETIEERQHLTSMRKSEILMGSTTLLADTGWLVSNAAFVAIDITKQD